VKVKGEVEVGYDDENDVLSIPHADELRYPKQTRDTEEK
jgi:hypothetical protein